MGKAGSRCARTIGWRLVRGATPDATSQFPAGYVQWYRVATVGDSSDPTQPGELTLAGPDWPLPKSYTPGNSKDMLIVVGQEVVGVYTTTIDLDTDTTWKN